MAQPDSPDEKAFVSLGTALTRVIGELTEMRIRQRAVLHVLGAGEFSWEKYVDAVRLVRKRDFEALFESIVLHEDAFIERNKAWMESDMERYLYKTSLEKRDSPALPARKTRKSKPVGSRPRKHALKKRS